MDYWILYNNIQFNYILICRPDLTFFHLIILLEILMCTIISVRKSPYRDLYKPRCKLKRARCACLMTYNTPNAQQAKTAQTTTKKTIQISWHLAFENVIDINKVP